MRKPAFDDKVVGRDLEIKFFVNAGWRRDFDTGPAIGQIDYRRRNARSVALHDRCRFKGWATPELAASRRPFNHRETRIIMISEKTMGRTACIELTPPGIREMLPLCVCRTQSRLIQH
jgi:hypothetical protein